MLHCESNRATELPQRPSPRAPHSLRTSSSSDSDLVHHRSRTTERSPRLSDGRSPRGSQSEPLHQRKLGSRISDLESQLGQAQDELKCLKNQLASAEAAKRAAQELLDKKSRKPKRVPNSVEIQEKHSAIVQNQESNKKHSNDEYDDVQKETDVFEVPVQKATLEHKADLPPDSSSYDKLGPKNDEISLLKSKLDEKVKEVEVFREENAKIKSQLNEKLVKISSAESEIEELSLRLKQADQERAMEESSRCCSNRLGWRSGDEWEKDIREVWIHGQAALWQFVRPCQQICRVSRTGR